MVAYAEKKNDTDVICPQCIKPIAGYSLFGSTAETPGRVMRHYMGWCCNCNIGFEVVQYSLDGSKWLIHKYRYWAAVIPDGQAVPEKDWQLINQLPDTPVVMTGPGGDFTHVVEIKQSDMIRQARNIAGMLFNSLNELLNLMGNDKKQA